uniref:Uncharacterized protein n=1 Tax=Papilio polytes TaxID=76194 RepID=I4DSF7_PAPPL|nr:unknown unsecreted protein [Papilio polytes]
MAWLGSGSSGGTRRRAPVAPGVQVVQGARRARGAPGRVAGGLPPHTRPRLRPVPQRLRRRLLREPTGLAPDLCGKR